MFLARLSCDPKTLTDRKLEIRKRSRRMKASAERFLQAIVFIAFAVESRLKFVYAELGIAHRRRDTLGVVIKTFRHRVETALRLDGKGSVHLPAEWGRIEKTLTNINNARNERCPASYQSGAPGEIRTTPPWLNVTSSRSRRASCPACGNRLCGTGCGAGSAARMRSSCARSPHDRRATLARYR